VQRSVAPPLAPLTAQDIDAELAAARTRFGLMRVTDTDAEDPDWARFNSVWAEAMRANLATQPSRLDVPLMVLLLNDEAWLHLPGEIFTALTDRIKAQSPFATTVVSTLAAHFIGYIPDREDFAAGGYASTLVPRALQLPPYHRSVGDALVDGALALLHDLGGTE
jgi:hypothetical protein